MVKKRNPLETERKQSQLPPRDIPIFPLSHQEADFALKRLFDWISALDKPSKHMVRGYMPPSSSSASTKAYPPIANYLSSPIIARILAHVCLIFKSEPTLLNIKFPLNRSATMIRPDGTRELMVCGDIHGSLRELMAIFLANGIPPTANYLFLGDYVDRGKYSLAVILFLFLLKIRWPTHLYMLRGNHESFVVNSSYGFRKECKKHFPDETIFGLLNVVFTYMPLAAIVHNCAMCCHGGVSQWMTSRESISAIPRPMLFEQLSLYEHLVATDIMWADPKRYQGNWFAPSIGRGCGFSFNESGLLQVLQNMRCNLLIRGHEAKSKGVEEMFGSRCITVHSTSLQAGDRAATLRLMSNARGTALSFTALFHSRKEIRRLKTGCEKLLSDYNSYRYLDMKKIVLPKTDLRPVFQKIDDSRFFRRNVAGQDELYLWVQSNAGTLFTDYCRRKKVQRPKTVALRLFPLMLSVAFGEKLVENCELSHEAIKLLVKFSKHCGQQRNLGLLVDEDFERLEIADRTDSEIERQRELSALDLENGNNSGSSGESADGSPRVGKSKHTAPTQSSSAPPTVPFASHKLALHSLDQTQTDEELPADVEPTSLPRISEEDFASHQQHNRRQHSTSSTVTAIPLAPEITPPMSNQTDYNKKGQTEKSRHSQQQQPQCKKQSHRKRRSKTINDDEIVQMPTNANNRQTTSRHDSAHLATKTGKPKSQRKAAR